MKKFLAIIVLVFAVSMSSFAQEVKENESVVKLISLPKISKFKVVYVSENESPVKIKISDIEGEVVFSESIKEASFIRPYVLSDLPVGLYTVSVSNGSKTEEIEIAHTKRAEFSVASAE